MDVFEYADRRPAPKPRLAELMPGWRRGLAVVVLTWVFAYVFGFSVGLFEGIGLVPQAMRPLFMPAMGPDYYSAGWFEVFTHEALRQAMTAMVWLLIFALAMAPAFWLAWRWLVGRPIRALMGPAEPFRRDFLLLTTLGLPILGAELAWVFTQSRIGPQNWAGLFPIQTALLLVLAPFQTLGEEVIFRGFLQGWLYRRTGWAAVSVIVQAAVFTAVHPGIEIAIFVLGLVTGIAAHRTRALGASWAIHLLNNLFALCLLFRPELGGYVLAGYERPPILAPQFVFLLLLPLFFRMRRRRAAWPG